MVLAQKKFRMNLISLLSLKEKLTNKFTFKQTEMIKKKTEILFGFIRYLKKVY